VTPSKKAVVGWILVSYFMIAGGFTLAAVVVALAGMQAEWAREAVFFVGALIGGLFAGRASPHKAVAEPAIAGLLFVPTLVAVFTIGLGWQLRIGPAAQSALIVALKMGGVSGLGGLVGGLIGRRSATNTPGASAFRWWGIAILLHLGATLVVAMLVTLALARSGDSEATGLIFLALAIASLVGGFIAQAALSRRLLWTCGAGSFSLAFLGIAVATARGELAPSTLFGGLILGGITTLIGAFGALLGWHIVARHHEPPTAADLPEAHVHS
jgi:hypothetical protein